MLDLSTVTHREFEATLDSTFRLTDGSDLTLINVKLLPSPSPRQQAFSLLFVHPTLVLPQATQILTHPQLGAMEVFLVPVQPDARGRLYEAVFN